MSQPTGSLADDAPRRAPISRALYSLVLRLLFPLALLLSCRGVAGQRRQCLADRLGLAQPGGNSPVLWLHAASVGEVNGARPLIEALLAAYPGHELRLTTMTATGAARARDLFGERIHHSFLPLDTPGATRRFIDRLRPQVAIIMETELWPNLYYQLWCEQVPLVLANARISPGTFSAYRRFGNLMQATLAATTRVGAQSEADAHRLRLLGAGHCEVAGNLKFDIELPADARDQGLQWRREWAASRPVWIAASTREGEEPHILSALQDMPAEVLLILVPRHPQRFDDVAALCQREGLALVRRSRGELPSADTRVFLGDTMGELVKLYATADVAFVGGSLVALGGQNPLEPAALGVPVLTGPSQYNFEAIAAQLQSAGALEIVGAAGELAVAVKRLLADESARQHMGQSGRDLVKANRGASDRYLAMVQAVLSEHKN